VDVRGHLDVPSDLLPMARWAETRS
jgi:hypothetical protein